MCIECSLSLSRGQSNHSTSGITNDYQQQTNGIVDKSIRVNEVNVACSIAVGDADNSRILNIPTPQEEHDRIRILRESDLFDTPPEEDYERFTALASRTSKVTFWITLFFC